MTWAFLASVVAVPTLVPIAASVHAYMQLDPVVWSHLTGHVLPRVVPNTLWLVASVSLGVAVVGTALALIVALHEFPGRGFFAWALLAPLAIPAYVLATVFVGTLDYAGTVATGLRAAGITLPEVRNGAGATVVLVAALYPYVYLVVRAALASQGVRALEVARTLGLSHRRALVRVAIPLAWPAIAAGTLLAAMETLADFGAVAALNYDTFTTAIYQTWFALFSVSGALQLAGVLVVLVLALHALVRALTGARRYTQAGPAPLRLRLRGWPALACSAACTLVLALCFGLPAMQLLRWSAAHLADLDVRLARAAGNAAVLALAAAALTVSIAGVLAYAGRAAPGLATRTATRIATLGYALPGAVLAVGLFVPLAGAVSLINRTGGLSLTVHDSVAVLVLAYAVRFLAVAHAPVSTALARVGSSVDEGARLAGVTGFVQLRRIHLPLLRPALAAGAALVLVDVIKEMPITLMMRPFGWDTLAVRVFELTSEGQWQRAALPALGIVAVGLAPVWWLTRTMDSEGRGAPTP